MGLQSVYYFFDYATTFAGHLWLHQFDSAIQRFVALKATGYDHFKPTPKTTGIGILLIGAPILGYAYLLKYYRDKQEQLYRTGQVAYKDRSFKFQ